MGKYEREVLEFLDEFAENNQIQIANMGIVMALNNYDSKGSTPFQSALIHLKNTLNQNSSADMTGS